MGSVSRLLSLRTSFPKRTDVMIRSYVPVSVDYTDLIPIMAFFRGDTKGNGAHDHLAKEIADAGKMWTEDMWHWSDMQVCRFPLRTLVLRRRPEDRS